MIANLAYRVLGSVNHNRVLCYSDRLEGSESVVVDTKLSIAFGLARIFVEVSNLFDEAYSEIRSAPMPDRWVRAGLSLYLDSH